MTSTSWMGDLGMVEQFLYFPLHQDLQKYCGKDLHPFFHPSQRSTFWLCWTQCMMGLCPSSPGTETTSSLPSSATCVAFATCSIRALSLLSPKITFSYVSSDERYWTRCGGGSHRMCTPLSVQLTTWFNMREGGTPSSVPSLGYRHNQLALRAEKS